MNGDSLSSLTLAEGPAEAAAVQQNPRAVFFSNFKRYLSSELPAASAIVAKAKARVASIEQLEAKTVAEFLAKDEKLSDANTSLNDAVSLFEWLGYTDGITTV